MEANQNRKEFKFRLSPEIGDLVRQEVSEQLAADRGFSDGYPVLSEYFDTKERASYWQKQLGSPNRRRIRTRVYGEANGSIDASAFIEVKHKLDGSTVKRRVMVPLEDLSEFSAGNRPSQEDFTKVADKRLAEEVESLADCEGFEPVVQIRYHRFAYDSGPAGTIRITFDVKPQCRFNLISLQPGCEDFELPLLEEGAMLMEVKTIGPVPFWFRRLLGKYRLVPSGFSKYSTALELYEMNLKNQLARRDPAGKRCPDLPALGEHSQNTELPSSPQQSPAHS